MPWGSFGPTLAAIVVCVLNGRARALLRGVAIWRMGARWYLVAVAAPIIGMLLALLPYFATHRVSPTNFDELFLAIPLYFAILVVGGPLGEELGWRGYALPRLLEKRGPLVASLVLAVLWFVWHVPLFWMEGASQKGSSIALFFAMVIATAILFTWLYLKTNRSLLLVILFHTSINFATWGAGELIPSAADDPVTSAMIVGILIVSAGLVAIGWQRAVATSEPMLATQASAP